MPCKLFSCNCYACILAVITFKNFESRLELNSSQLAGVGYRFFIMLKSRGVGVFSSVFTSPLESSAVGDPSSWLTCSRRCQVPLTRQNSSLTVSYDQ